jgi:putative phosphoribosyl transferase
MDIQAWSVVVPHKEAALQGELHVPPSARGVILFAHGSGSSRFSPRNQFVARQMQQAGLATLLMDLLEEEEAQDRAKVFDIEFLAERLRQGVHWLGQNEFTRALPVGLFGASTGAAAALVLAGRHPEKLAAVVSRGGRPDLAWEDLPSVKAPTLLIVGGDDQEVLELNRAAQARLTAISDLEVIPGATHLFPEPGALETVAKLASSWFRKFLQADPDAATQEEAHVSQS